MIDMKDKATSIGVIEAIEAEGINIWQESSGWKTNNPARAQEIIDSWDETAYIRALMPAVTRAQMKLALLEFNLLDAIDAFVAAADKATQIAYNDVLTFERNNPLLNAAATQLGMTQEQVDAVFQYAASLTPGG